jgi:hypothetical protein
MTRRTIYTDVAQMPLVMSMSDIATLLSCSVRTVKRLKKAGALPPPILESFQPRYSREAIASWLSGGSTRGRRR